jgi:hypothetical protein
MTGSMWELAQKIIEVTYDEKIAICYFKETRKMYDFRFSRQ